MSTLPKIAAQQIISGAAFLGTLAALLATDPVNSYLAHRQEKARYESLSKATQRRAGMRVSFALGYHLAACRFAEPTQTQARRALLVQLADSLTLPDSIVSQFKRDLLSTCEGADRMQPIIDRLDPVSQRLFILAWRMEVYRFSPPSQRGELRKLILQSASEINSFDVQIPLRTAGVEMGLGDILFLVSKFLDGRATIDQVYASLFHNGPLSAYPDVDSTHTEPR
jgi:hypothetical protein